MLKKIEKTKRLGKDLIKFWCPHCDGAYSVQLSRMRPSSRNGYRTVACPYCFGTAYLPVQVPVWHR